MGQKELMKIEIVAAMCKYIHTLAINFVASTGIFPFYKGSKLFYESFGNTK
jgi:hypothetical protein